MSEVSSPARTDDEIRALFMQAMDAVKPKTPTGVPLHKHGAFDDLQAHLSFIQLGADALKGLGAMFQPSHHSYQLDQAFSSDAAAVFRFFGEALENPANEAYNSMERLQRAAQGEQV